jgi:hypothetical protein
VREPLSGVGDLPDQIIGEALIGGRLAPISTGLKDHQYRRNPLRAAVTGRPKPRNPVTINRHDLFTFKSCCGRRRKSPERCARRLFAGPGRAMNASDDAFADQAVDARHVNVICFVLDRA